MTKRKIESLSVTARADEDTGVAIIEAKSDGTVVALSKAYGYQAPAILQRHGRLFAAFSEFYDGTFEPYTAYELTKV